MPYELRPIDFVGGAPSAQKPIMLTCEKAEQLLSFLASLPEPLALRLTKAVEVDRLAEGKHLPHDLIVDGLRPALRNAERVERTPTPMRLFCQPFEDLLSSQPRKEKQKGRIARSSIEPVWSWLTQSLLAGRSAEYCAQVRGAVLGSRLEEARACAAAFWPEAGSAMRAALRDEVQGKTARLALGGEAALQDAMEMSWLLSGGNEIAALQALMPRHQPDLTDELICGLLSIHDRLVAVCPDAAPYVAVVAMNRLERTWEALRLPLPLARQTHDTLVTSTGMELVGELLLADLDGHAMAICAVKQPQFEASALVGHLAGFTLLSNGIAHELEMRRDGHQAQRLMRDRAAVAQIMDAIMVRAPGEILAAIPALTNGAYAGRPRMPDLSRPFDFDKGARALNYAMLLAGCKPLAAAAAFGSSHAAANTEVGVALKSYGEDIVRELRAAEGESLARVEPYFALTVELTRILFGAEEGETLTRRGRAALGAQVVA